MTAPATFAAASDTSSEPSTDGVLNTLRELADDEQLPMPVRILVHRRPDSTHTMSLDLADVDALRAWAAHVDSTDLEPTGPHRIGPCSFVAVTGRLNGTPIVLCAEVPHDHPAPAPAEPDDGPPTADHDTAGWRAAIDAATTGAGGPT